MDNVSANWRNVSMQIYEFDYKKNLQNYETFIIKL